MICFSAVVREPPCGISPTTTARLLILSLLLTMLQLKERSRLPVGAGPLWQVVHLEPSSVFTAVNLGPGVPVQAVTTFSFTVKKDEPVQPSVFLATMV